MHGNLLDKIGEKLILLDRFTQSKNRKKAKEVSQELEAMREQVSKQKDALSQKDETEMRDLSRYPEYDDAEFQAKIFRKNEFFKSKYPKTDTSLGYEALVDKECSQKFNENKQLKLSRNQVFLKNFMSKQTPYKNVLLFHGVGVGKCHLKDTPILLYSGNTRKVQDVRVGDRLMGDDSSPRVVTSLARGYDTMFRISYEKYRSFVVNKDHILVLFFKYSSILITEDFIDLSRKYLVIHVDQENHTLVEVRFDDELNAKAYESYIQEYIVTDDYKNFIQVTVEDYVRMSDLIQECLFLRRADIRFFENSTMDDDSMHKRAYDHGKMIGGSSVRGVHGVHGVQGVQGVHGVHEGGILPVVRFGSKTVRQAFLAGFLNACRKTYDGLRWFPYDETLEFIALSSGLSVHRKEDYDRKRNKWVKLMLLSIPLHEQDKGSAFHVSFAIWEMYVGQFEPDFESSCIKFDVQELDHPNHYYGFTLDGNNRYLLGDAIITHNTCSAISIAEQYHSYYKNPVTVLMPRNLKDNFIKQIYDPETMGGCASSKYLSMIPKRSTLPKTKIHAMINQFINSRYRFSGFTEFANEIDKIEDKYTTRYPNVTDKDIRNTEIYNEIKKNYSNRVFVIDEVHNIRSEENEKKGLEKRATRRIIQVLQAADNVRLVLLSATPMYNGTKEIVGIFNIMLANDKQDLLENKDIFSETGKVTRAGEAKLIQLSKSYVSFMRGNNPFTFPFQLYPKINDDPNVMKRSEIPKKTITGRPIPPQLRLNTIVDKLIINRLSPRQEKVYNYLKPKLRLLHSRNDDGLELGNGSESRPRLGSRAKDSMSNVQSDSDSHDAFSNEGEGEDEDKEECDEAPLNPSSPHSPSCLEKESQERRQMSKLVQTSILTYPTTNPETAQGEKGFNMCFKKTGFKSARGERAQGRDKGNAKNARNARNAKTQFEYKPGTGAERFLSYDEVGKHSSKIKSIIDYIDGSEGIVFIYSRFLFASLIPLAMALEHIGFIRSDNTTLLANPSPIRNPPHKIKVDQSQTKIQQRYTPRYSLLTGHTAFSSDIAREVSLINNPNNANGELVKVVLGTSVSAEGIDFKNIRQVHIVEPWYHLNKLNQVIGRAVRNCSHYNLPPEKRNVTIYQHAAVNPSDGSTESIDLRLYGMSERKQREIDKIERIMATNAVDCALNQNRLFYPASEMNLRLPSITTSQGVVVKNYMVGDEKGSKFNGMKCSLTERLPELENISHSELDFKTYNKDFYDDDIITYKGLIKAFVHESNDNGVFSFNRLVDRMRDRDESIDSDVLKFALESMLNKKDVVMNKNGEVGHLVYFSNKYMFQPKVAPDAYFSKRQRKGLYIKSINQVYIDEKLIRSKKSERPGIMLNAQKRKEFEKLVQNQNLAKNKGKELVEIDEAEIAKQFEEEEMKRLLLENTNMIEKIQKQATELLREYFSHIIDGSEEIIPFTTSVLNNRPVMKGGRSGIEKYTTYVSSFGILCLIQSAYDFVIDREMSEHVSALLEDIIEQTQVQMKIKGRKANDPVSSLMQFVDSIDERFIQHKNNDSSRMDHDTKAIVDDMGLSLLLCARSLINGRYMHILSNLPHSRKKQDTTPIVFFRNPTFLTEKYGYQAIRNHAGLRSKIDKQITNGQALLILKKRENENENENDKNEDDYVLKESNSYEILLFSENSRHAFDYMTDENKLIHLKGTFSQWGKSKYNEFKHINELKKKGVLCGTGVISDIPYLTDLVSKSDFKRVSKARFVKNDLCIMYEMILRYKTHLTGHLFLLRPVEKFVYDLRAIELDNNNPLRKNE